MDTAEHSEGGHPEPGRLPDYLHRELVRILKQEFRQSGMEEAQAGRLVELVETSEPTPDRVLSILQEASTETARDE